MGAPRADWFHVCVFRPSKYGVRAAIPQIPCLLWHFPGREGLDFHTLRFWLAFLSIWYSYPSEGHSSGAVGGGVGETRQVRQLPWGTWTRLQALSHSRIFQPPPPHRRHLWLHAGSASTGGRCWSWLCCWEGSISEQPSLAKAHPALLGLVVPISSTGSGDDVMCASVHPGAGDMGSKLSMPGGEPIVQSPRTEGIHDAYRQGDVSRAQHLLRKLVMRAHPSWKRYGLCQPCQNSGPWLEWRLPWKLFSCYHYNNGDISWVLNTFVSHVNLLVSVLSSGLLSLLGEHAAPSFPGHSHRKEKDKIDNRGV